MDTYYEKYLKYKNKYAQLKNKILKMKGGSLSNLTNSLVMGAGPVGLLNTLALLTRYPYRTTGDINSIDSNNIFLVGKENPWRPQIFFLQNSFREYNSIDFIRDIDMETYRHLEQIGCYIGSPPSTMTPFCFSRYENSQTKNYVPSALAVNSTDIRAPSQMTNNQNVMTEPIYLMHHLSFQVTDFETILLNRIFQINQENINYYCAHSEARNFEEKITCFINKVGSSIFNENCSLDLFKALVVKNYLVTNNQISISDFKPLVIVLHPINKYCNINTWLLYKLFISNYTEEQIQIYKKTIKSHYISKLDEDQTGNSFTNLWDVKVLPNGSIYLKTSANKTRAGSKYSLSRTDLTKCASENICTPNGDIIFLKSEDYEFVFEAESKNKQFGSKSDYYYLKNRSEMTIDKKNKFILQITPLLARSLGRNHIIEVHTSESQHDYYLIIDRKIVEEVGNIKIQFEVRKLTPSPLSTKLHDMRLDLNSSFLEMLLPIRTITEFARPEYETMSVNDIIKIFNQSLYRETDPLVQSTIKLLRHLYTQNLDLILINSGRRKNVTSIKKINTLGFEEKPFDLSKTNPDEDAIVYASVWMFEANNTNNKMFYSDKSSKIIKTDGVTQREISNIPLCSGPNCLAGTYVENFEETYKLKNKVDKKSIVNQVYINNDQVQYFNNKIQTSGIPNSSDLIHQTSAGNNPQHVFRVFGVNLHKEEIKNSITTPKLEKFIDISSNKKFYYTGIQVSTEINMLLRKFKGSDLVNVFKRNLILKNLYMISYLYSQHDYFDETDDDDIVYFIGKIDEKWNNTYGKTKPTKLDKVHETPINETFATVFPITLRYKVKTIESQEINGKVKIIFNLGDSNTTVNFFSGTGLNTGILNVKKILNEYKKNIQAEELNCLNKSYEKSNRRTIYNSLLSSQNSSILSVQRNFENNYGPFIQNVSNKSLEEINRIIDSIISKKKISPSSGRIYVINSLLNSFDKIFKLFAQCENDKHRPNDTGFRVEMLDNELSDYNKILKALKWNLFVCLYNLVEPPVLSSRIDYDKESITYLNNLIYNYSDFCNFNRKQENKNYYCDSLENTTEPVEYDPTRSEGLLISHELTT